MSGKSVSDRDEVYDQIQLKRSEVKSRKLRRREVKRADQSGVEREEQRGYRVRGEINIIEWHVAKRLRVEVVQEFEYE